MLSSTIVLVALAARVLAAPVLIERQGAGVGDGCNAIFSDADTASGQVVKQGGAYIANLLGGAKTGGLARRQRAGVGAGCDAIFTDADTASGQVVKQAGAYIANELKKAPAGKRQLDKMGSGIGQIVEALPNGQQAGEAIISSTGTIDGDGTEGSAMAGEAVGALLLNAGNGITKTAFGTTTKRQLDKMGAGIGYVVSALPGGEAAGEEITSVTGTVDGNGTEGSADLGEAIGQFELDAGNAITKTAFGTTTSGGGSGRSTGGAAPAPKPAPGKPAPH